MKKTLCIVLLLSYNISSCQEVMDKKSGNVTLEPLRIPTVEEIKEKHCKNENSPQQKDLQKNNVVPSQPQQPQSRRLIMPDKWIVEFAINNAPQLLKGIFAYLQSLSHRGNDSFFKNLTVGSYHRFILVGPPGSGKTTLAYALADMLGWKTTFQPASGLLGRFRNETSMKILGFFNRHMADNEPKIIIIDELHKLFEHHDNDHSDDSQSATAFWQGLDMIEKECPEVIIIGTANSVDKLPPELKSRFAGKVITISLPHKQKKIELFKAIIEHNQFVDLHYAIDDTYIEKIISKISDGSLRNIQLLIDSAKMFYYAENTKFSCFPIILTKKHFNLALQQLQEEASLLNGSVLEQFRKKLEKWGVVFSVAANVVFLIKSSVDLCGSRLFFTRSHYRPLA